ncbi:MAG: DUF3721 domain-containing protein [Cyanobacteriota bacterium]|nr:DUF3721 domain-containing protein [Cyanobacteriota bacterium]
MTTPTVALLQMAVALSSLVGVAPAVEAHSKGLYRTQAEAEQRARELGCAGTHQNNGLWMPCGNEAHLHQELRQE